MIAADYLLYNYRAFATLLAKGVTPEELMGDLLMNALGTSRGHGGIMHVTAPERGIVGRNGVFGSKFGIALGLAHELVVNRRGGAVFCMFGEAEGNRGGLYEAMNLAALRKLPILFVAENNGFAVAAPTSLLYATGDMSGQLAVIPDAGRQDRRKRPRRGGDAGRTPREGGAGGRRAGLPRMRHHAARPSPSS